MAIYLFFFTSHSLAGLSLEPWVKQITDKTLASLGQKIDQINSSYVREANGSSKIEYYSVDGTGCPQSTYGKKIKVAEIAFETLVSGKQITQLIHYKGCKEQHLFTEKIIYDSLLPELVTFADLLAGRRAILPTGSEKYRIYSLLDGNQVEFLRFQSEKQTNSSMTVKLTQVGTEIATLILSQYPQNIEYIKYIRSTHSTKFNLGNGNYHISYEGNDSGEIIDHTNGVRYQINNQLTSKANFDILTNDHLKNRIPDARMLNIVNNLISGFPVSVGAPRSNLLVDQLEEVIYLFRARQQLDYIQTTLESLLDAAIKGKILDQR